MMSQYKQIFFSWRFLSLLIVGALTFTGCARRQDEVIVGQLRTRAMQTRFFVGYTMKKVVKEVIATLQDEGFIVKNFSPDMGILTAEKNVSIEKFLSKFCAYIFSGRQARWKKYSVIEVTANIFEEDEQAKVRVNFMLKEFDNAGNVVDVHPIVEDEPYMDFFNKVQKGLLSSSSLSINRELTRFDNERK